MELNFTYKLRFRWYQEKRETLSQGNLYNDINSIADLSMIYE